MHSAKKPATSIRTPIPIRTRPGRSRPTATRSWVSSAWVSGWVNADAVPERLLQHIATFHPLSAGARAAIAPAFEEVHLEKGASLVRPGQICRHLYFLESGALRGYYLADGKEVTHWFALAEEFVTSFHSFSTGTASVEHVQLLEDAVLWSISKERLAGLLDQHHELERALRIAYERYYIRLEERFLNAQFRSAADRYRDVLEGQPELLQRVPLGHLASWLGISAETLSRIRSRLSDV
ncbi:MAG: Crp/Fnr family transcriptional regulator [Chitinophagaceae bacterium]|nr:MAG: Crp/Fnr family transcriptional regulator [Chitinophagaceae bacterium]